MDGFYFGDQWKATSRLTVNWGLRYDLTLLTTWGVQSDNTIYVGSLNGNDGTYILQVPTPFCSQTGRGPLHPGWLAARSTWWSQTTATFSELL